VGLREGCLWRIKRETTPGWTTTSIPAREMSVRRRDTPSSSLRYRSLPGSRNPFRHSTPHDRKNREPVAVRRIIEDASGRFDRDEIWAAFSCSISAPLIEEAEQVFENSVVSIVRNFDRLPISQAGRRGFDPRLPLFGFIDLPACCFRKYSKFSVKAVILHRSVPPSDLN